MLACARRELRRARWNPHNEPQHIISGGKIYPAPLEFKAYRFVFIVKRVCQTHRKEIVQKLTKLFRPVLSIYMVRTGYEEIRTRRKS